MLKRRDCLVAGVVPTLAGPPSVGLAQEPAPANALARSDWNDGLAHPISFESLQGIGKERGLVLGGGGVYLASWMVGYFTALKSQGVDFAQTDIVVGTSAGSVVGAALMGDHLWRLRTELDVLGKSPELFAALIPAMAPNPSQLFARHTANTASQANPEVIQSIGHAAMAARNPAGPSDYPTTVKRLIGEVKWPSPKLHVTAVDCYTGQRLIVSHAEDIPINAACAASSSLPGGMGPTWLKDRLCMDGGICQTSTHSDVVAGVKRALIVSLSDGGPDAVKIGLRTSGLPNTLQEEVKTLEAGGTKVTLKVVGLLPGIAHVDSLMDPRWIGPCLKNGHERGLADAGDMAAFWGTS